MSTPSRNAPCPCGSGKRYKECHGGIASSAIDSPLFADTLIQRLNRALEAQRISKFDEAAQLYESVLVDEPNHFDAKHMLGVVRLEQNRASEATKLILEALDSVDWSIPAAIHNLALAVGKVLSPNQAHFSIGSHGARYREHMRTTLAPIVNVTAVDAQMPLVSVVMPSYNHAPYIESAIDSVIAQTYPNWELIVIDDGSTDATAKLLEKVAAAHDSKVKIFLRENRGAHATLNELVSLASGAWIQPLNSDDRLDPERISIMLNATRRHSTEWGFGGVRAIDAQGRKIDEMANDRAFALRCEQSELPLFETLSLSFFSCNPTVSTGNLFFTKALFEEVGGFGDLRYHHDWDFCLKASRICEPFFESAPSYLYRIHETNTISEHSAKKQIELGEMMRRHIRSAFSTDAPNPWLPSYERCGTDFISHLLNRGVGEMIDRAHLRTLAQQAITGRSE
jgi:glycosyltransferase involved in cell wall biosynthesis